MIELFFEDVLEFNLSVDDINIWLTGVCVSENKSLGDVNIIFCSDEYLL
jgi:hypothetical protein